MDLREIMLTKDNGFVLRASGEPVEILGGVQMGRVTKNDPQLVIVGVRDAIERVYADQVPSGTNGYILHMPVLLREHSDRVPEEEREIMTVFSAVVYQKK
jgi:hypothetical protein